MSDAIKKPAHYNQGPIECIDAMKIVLTPEEFRGYLKGNVFKYLWREKDKNGIEDLRKGKDYYDRLIELLDASEGQPVIKQSSTTEPPDGWRWLEVGEVIRKGDRFWYEDAWHDRHVDLIGREYSLNHCKSIRRNKFEVGEKVVWVADDTVWTVHQQKSEITSCQSYIVISGNLGWLLTTANKLAPYIEEQS